MSDSEEPVSKRRRIEEEPQEPDSFEDLSILHFPDDLLLTIFSFVDFEDLLSLSKTCERFNYICYDKTLWERVDLRKRIYKVQELKKFSHFFQRSTKFLATRGGASTPGVSNSDKLFLYPLTKSFMKDIIDKCPNLKTLILENHIIDSSKILIEDFPGSVEELQLIDCDLRNLPERKSYFYNLEFLLPQLRVLELSNNKWFNPHSLLALSKSQTLEKLTLRGCDLSDSLPYASLAANFGFASLKVLDLRKTCISDTEVTCFNRMQSLRQLYLCGMDIPDVPDHQVTDYSITTFGNGPRSSPEVNINAGVIVIEVGAVKRPACKLETLVINNYPGITDLTLRHIVASMMNLKLLDITGTGCSEAGILEFKQRRPDVQVIPEVIG